MKSCFEIILLTETPMGLRDLLRNFTLKKIDTWHNNTVTNLKYLVDIIYILETEREHILKFLRQSYCLRAFCPDLFSWRECISTITIVTICRAVNYEGPRRGIPQHPISQQHSDPWQMKFKSPCHPAI